ncbi:MAG: tol-pal system-associated acyl-CoA thioesterase [Pseudomonadota bacterium]
MPDDLLNSTQKHIHNVRVYFEDTDAAGIVYYANYLKFAERARTEMLREFGLHHSLMLQQNRQAFVVRQCTVDYLHPGFLDDCLAVQTSVTELRRMTVTMQQEIIRQGEKLVQISVKLACIDNQKKPIRIPVAFIDALEMNRFCKIALRRNTQ